MRALAVFDYDGTVISGQSGSLFSLYLLRRGLIHVSTGLRLLWWGARYKLHLPYRQNESRELIFRELSRLTPSEVDRIMREFHDEVLKPLYRADALREFAERREEGCVTLLVSATFEPIARVAAAFLGADGAVATRMETDGQGRFTGEVLGDVVAGEEKPRAAAAWADKNLGAGAWRIAYAYGDHFTDASLLARADVCFAVCPGRTLRVEAQRRGWRILDWK